MPLWGGEAAPGSATAAATVYVDPQIAEDHSTTYDPATRTCGAGAAEAYKTLRGAADAATAGQTVLLRGGKYAEPLIPRNSGRAGAYITFRSFPKEKATITGAMRPAINISGRSYLILEGLEVADVEHWLYALKSHHNILRGNHFARAMHKGGSAKTGLFFQQATFNQVVGNTIEETTQDNLALVRSDRNLVEGNTIRKAKHTLWAIKGGSYNVLRMNFFHNEWQKIGEIYDCEAVGFDHEFTMFNCTKRNLVEANTFAYTPSSGRSSPYAGIQYAGQDGIIRRNVFRNTVGPALDLTLYSKEATYNTGNRVYGNVFYATDYAGVALAGSSRYAFADNIFKNNILAESVFVANDTRWAWYTRELAGKPVQLLTGGTNGFEFERNNFFAAKGDPSYLITHGSRTSRTNPPPRKLAWWEKLHDKRFHDNLSVDPQFVDPAKRDFRLKPGSAMIDAGAFLTQTASAGSGTAMPVQDVGWFFDGFDIPGQEGDLIQLEGQQQTAQVTDIDYEKKVLKLRQPLTWRAGQGVALRYFGRRPDIGVFEYVPTGQEPPVALLTARPDAQDSMRFDFDASGSSAAGGASLRFDWDFGDGHTQLKGPAKAAHTYAKEGAYTAKLIVRREDKPALAATAALAVHPGRPRLAVRTESLDFGMTDAERPLTLTNAGTGTLAYTATASAPWLKAEPASGTCVSGEQGIRVLAAREGLKPGAHEAWIVVDAGLAGRSRVPVRITVPDVATLELIKLGDTWRYFKGKTPPPKDWNQLACDDGKWLEGPTGIGYSDDIRLATRLDDMLGKYVAFFARRKFRVADPAAVLKLTLGMVYDDGFVAYVNGVEVARSASMGEPGSPVSFNAEAKASHSEEAPEELFPIKLAPGLLRGGENVLAVQVHNVYIKSSDAVLAPRLLATLVRSTRQSAP